MSGLKCICDPLTGAVVIGVVSLRPAAADSQEGFVVIVLVPVKGSDSGESPLGVAAYEARGSGHHLPEGQIALEERSHNLEELHRAIPLEQLWRNTHKQNRWKLLDVMFEANK